MDDRLIFRYRLAACPSGRTDGVTQEGRSARRWLSAFKHVEGEDWQIRPLLTSRCDDETI